MTDTPTTVILPVGWSAERAQRELDKLVHDEEARIVAYSHSYQHSFTHVTSGLRIELCDLAEVLRQNKYDRLPAGLAAVIYATNVPAGIRYGHGEWMHAQGGLLPRPLVVAANVTIEAESDVPGVPVQLLAVVFEIPR